MKAIRLTGFEGLDSLEYSDVSIPRPAADEVLIRVKAAGINYAEVEQIYGRYMTFGKELPFVMGFEVAGIVAEVGRDVTHIKPGDSVMAFSVSGGFAEYSTAKADSLVPIPAGVSYAKATTIPIQGMTAYTLLKYLVLPHLPESILIQAAAGGVGIYLVQLAKLLGIKTVIGLVGSDEKAAFVSELGADVVINYARENWAHKVRQATNNKGVDVVLQMLVDEVGKASFKLLAPEGRIILFGSKNYNDVITTDQIRQLIWNNQTLVGFAFPALSPEKVIDSLPELLQFIQKDKLRIVADFEYTLEQYREAFADLQNRKTIGKVFFSL